MSDILKDMFRSNLDHGLRLDSVPIDFSPESGRLRDVHITVSDFGRFFDQAGKGRREGSVCARGRPGRDFPPIVVSDCGYDMGISPVAVQPKHFREVGQFHLSSDAQSCLAHDVDGVI